MFKDEVIILLCFNFVCKVILSFNDGFCKRCLCCVCYYYDDNKDLSFWLICDFDFFNGGDLCGMFCYLKCVFRYERVGIMKNGKCGKLDGKFYCVFCGKINDLMR